MNRRLQRASGCSAFVFLIVLALLLPQISRATLPASSDTAQELYLLRVEHYLYLNASADIGTFHVRFSFPPDYEDQAPLILELYNDSTTTKILHYSIVNDSEVPNQVINFTLGPLMNHESMLLHFSCWVLVKNNDFSDLPAYVKIPQQNQLPQNTTLWLASTKEVQLNSILLKQKAAQLHGSDDNLIDFAGTIAPFIKNHRFALFVIELHAGLLLSQDARTTLLINGENVGRSHLACAFFRLNTVPARVLLANNDQGFWTQMHYLVEYYCPGYGWVIVETTKGISPYATRHQVINRVCYPSDENDTKKDYIFPFMTGEERWLWIDTPTVAPYYVDCKQGSKSQMFTEANLTVDSLTANEAFSSTQHAFQQYHRFLGANLTGENLNHYLQAVLDEKKAITALKNSDVGGYLFFLNEAVEEYGQIIR